MERLKRFGLAALASVGIAGFAAVAVDEPKIYTIPEQIQCMAEGNTAEECCVNIDGCGVLCYNGIRNNMFNGTMNGEQFRYLISEAEMYPQGCHLERGDLTEEHLVVVHRE